MVILLSLLILVICLSHYKNKLIDIKYYSYFLYNYINGLRSRISIIQYIKIDKRNKCYYDLKVVEIKKAY